MARQVDTWPGRGYMAKYIGGYMVRLVDKSHSRWIYGQKGGKVYM